MGPDLIIGAVGAALWLASCGLLWRLFHRAAEVPPVDRAGAGEVSVIIPARNEAANLPALLDSLRHQPTAPLEVLVVDDDSDDGTEEVARRGGASVIRSQPLPEGWRGKPWACHQGARAARGELLLFLDADCRLEPGGLDRLLARYEGGAYSVAPWHAVERPYEELSAFFNAIMVAATVPGGLFGQVLLVEREAHERAGGHEAVKGRVLENLRLASIYRQHGLPVGCSAGKGMVRFRMYPDGFAALVEGWTKGFASGAAETPRLAVIGVAAWISGLIVALVAPLFGAWLWGLYLLFALQFGIVLRRVGGFSWLTALAYPVVLLFYLGLFLRSSRRSGRTVTWKGREIHAD
jgi:4,4'-diaponeurosporenoate glycosyltransferase